jgi:hypothetical protein
MSGLWLFGAVVAGVATAALLWWGRSLSRENAIMQRLQTSNAVDVARFQPGIHVELKGALRCTVPIRAEFSNAECVWHRSRVEEQRTTQDTDDKPARETVEIYRLERWAQCEIEDATGRVMLVGQITKAGAKIEGVEVCREKRTAFPSSVGNLAKSVLSGSNFQQTQIEEVLTPNVDVYVVATVLNGGGVGPDANRRNLFLVSTRSEEQRMAGNTSTAKWVRVSAIALACFAALCLFQWMRLT